MSVSESVSESEIETVTVTARENRSLVRVQTVLDGIFVNVAPVLVDADDSAGAAVSRMY
jgi:hypothetical protein